jgi:FkbM family methyltransferase
MKTLFNTCLQKAINLFRKTSFALYVQRQILKDIMVQSCSLQYGSYTLRFVNPNWITSYRIKSFSTKEPDTLAWIDSIARGSILWDIGANIGLYSIYAAISRQAKVYAFEPSVFNLELLARNIFLNNLQNQITIVPIALSDSKGPNLFKMSNTEWGGALSTFGENYDQEGKRIKDIFEYKILGMTMSDIVHLFEVPKPDYIKIDVDGIEHLILHGGAEVLSTIKSVMVEINDDFGEQADGCRKSLSAAGLQLFKKTNLGVAHTYNQWWVRLALGEKNSNKDVS